MRFQTRRSDRAHSRWAVLLRASSSYRNDSFRRRSLEFASADDVNGGFHRVAIELATDVPGVLLNGVALGGDEGGEQDGLDLGDVGVGVQRLVQFGADRVEVFTGRRHIS